MEPCEVKCCSNLHLYLQLVHYQQLFRHARLVVVCLSVTRFNLSREK